MFDNPSRRPQKLHPQDYTLTRLSGISNETYLSNPNTSCIIRTSPYTLHPTHFTLYHEP